MNSPYTPKISRRETLRWFAAAMALSSISHIATERSFAASSNAKGYGTDPDLNNPIVPWARTMTTQSIAGDGGTG